MHSCGDEDTGGARGGGREREGGRVLAAAGQRVGSGGVLVAAGQRCGTVSLLDPRLPRGWVSRAREAGGSKLERIQCPSCVCGMAALEGGGGGWYPDLVTSVMAGVHAPSGGGLAGAAGGHCARGRWSEAVVAGGAGREEALLSRWDLRRSDYPVLVYPGELNLN